jgi:hypothetical protein
MTMVWHMNCTDLNVMCGWTRRGEKLGFCFCPGRGTRTQGVHHLLTESAPVPIFGGGLREPSFEEGLEQLVDPKLGRLFEMTYDPAAGTIHGRYPNSRNAALCTSCLLYRDIPADELLAPMVSFSKSWNSKNCGMMVSIVND